MAKLYGVFWGTKWGMTRNKRVAITEAKKRDGATVRAKNDTPEIGSYDMPTFWALSDQIWPTVADTKPHLLGQCK